MRHGSTVTNMLQNQLSSRRQKKKTDKTAQHKYCCCKNQFSGRWDRCRNIVQHKIWSKKLSDKQQLLYTSLMHLIVNFLRKLEFEPKKCLLQKLLEKLCLIIIWQRI